MLVVELAGVEEPFLWIKDDAQGDEPGGWRLAPPSRYNTRSMEDLLGAFKEAAEHLLEPRVRPERRAG